jgi:hypothetical protein
MAGFLAGSRGEGKRKATGEGKDHRSSHFGLVAHQPRLQNRPRRDRAILAYLASGQR